MVEVRRRLDGDYYLIVGVWVADGVLSPEVNYYFTGVFLFGLLYHLLIFGSTILFSLVSGSGSGDGKGASFYLDTAALPLPPGLLSHYPASTSTLLPPPHSLL
ncbi:hypothetical protein E2C01_070103 [Portunus trituberculatus]|uniref:Uncharacterized protein n=1 Tax=Portunus trituberculatus TaxID=210409 RepID=A0A5B7HTB8_PORTR|nr:hypothetical protein [Portunus trituberculatus]